MFEILFDLILEFFFFIGLKKRKEKLGEKPGQMLPEGWSSKAVLPEQYRPKT